MLDLVAGDASRDDQRHERQRGAQRGHQNRRKALARAAQHELDAEGLSFHALEMAVMLHKQDPVSRRDSEHRDHSDQSTQRNDAVAGEGGERAADQRCRQSEKNQACEPPAPERRVQSEENRGRDEHGEIEQIALRRLALLEFAQQVRVVPDRKLHFPQPRLDFRRHRAEVASLHVAMDVDAPRITFALDHVGSRREPDVRDLAQPHTAAVRRVDEIVLHVVDAELDRRRRHHEDVVDLAVLVDVGDLDAGDQRRCDAADIARLQAVAPGPLEVHRDLDLRYLDLLLDMQVDEARDVLDGALNLLGAASQDMEIGTENAHHDRFARARENLLDPFPQIRLDIAVQAGVAGDHGLDARVRLVIVDPGVDADPVLGEVHVVRFVSPDRAADMGAEVPHTGNSAQLAARRLRDPDGFRMRGAFRRHPMHQEVPLLERRKQPLAKERPDRDAGSDQHGRTGERAARRPQGAREQADVDPLEPGHERRLAALDGGIVEQQQAERRGHRQRDGHRGQHRQDECKGEGLEERAAQPAHEEHRRHRQRDDEGRLPDRRTHLKRSLEDDARSGFVAARLALLAQPPHDVFDIDDGIIHHRAERNHEAGQHHGVDRGTHEVQRQPGRHERQRHCDDADQRHPPFVQERAEDQQDQDRADDDRHDQVMDRHLDEGRRPEDGGVDVHPRKPRPQIGQHFFHAARHVERVGPRQLLDDHHQTGTVVDDRVADHRPGVVGDVGDIAQPWRVSPPLVLHGDRHVGQVLGREHRGIEMNHQPLVRRVQHAVDPRFRSGGIPEQPEVQRLRGRFHDLIERDVVGAHQARIDLHLQRLDAVAPHRDVGHAGYGHQAELDRPVRDHRQVHHVEGLRREPDLHDAAGR